jgi:hypothetical protein
VETKQERSASVFLATLATYVVSAFWHGFYPGYYLTFTTGALVTAAESILRRVLTPLIYPHHDSEQQGMLEWSI